MHRRRNAESLPGEAEARCTGWGKLLELNGEADHVHLLLELPPNLDLSVFVNNLKTTSSRLCERSLRTSSTASIASRLWSRSSCIPSCGGAPLSILKQYIERRQAQR